MSVQNTKKSLYIYAGLIFFVAIVIIIVAFFGQEKIAREASDSNAVQSAAGIPERAAALSDENRLLTEKISELNKAIEQNKTDIAALTEKAAGSASFYDNLLKLVNSYNLCDEKKYDEANELFSSIDMAYISEETMPFYNAVSKRIIKKR